MAHNENRAPLIARSDVFTALGCTVAALALYVRTLLPGLLPGDGAEFQTLAYTLGHAHTTGYEVYILLAKLFTLLVPVGDIAYRVNLLSAVYGGITVGLVTLAGKVLSGSRLAGAAGAFVLAIAATFWSQAIIAEVYTAGSAFTSAILLLVLLWYRTKTGKYLFFAGMLGGLGVGIHGSVSLLAPAILLLIILYFRDLNRSWKPALAGLALGILLFVLAFVFIDAQPTQTSIIHSVYEPSISNWDLQPGDLDSFPARFVFLVFARQWRSAMFVDPGAVIPANFGVLRQFIAQDFAASVLILMAVGWVVLLLRDWRLGVFFLAAIAVHCLYTFNYRIGDIYVFFLSLYVYLSLLFAEGVAVFLRGMARIHWPMLRFAQPVLVVLLLVLAAAPFFPQRLAGLKAGEIHFDSISMESNQRLADWHNELRQEVKDLEKNAIVLVEWDTLYARYYVAQVELNRPDLMFTETHSYSIRGGVADSLIGFVKTNIKNGRPVYTTQRLFEVQRSGLSIRPKSVGFTNMYLVEDR